MVMMEGRNKKCVYAETSTDGMSREPLDGRVFLTHGPSIQPCPIRSAS